MNCIAVTPSHHARLIDTQSTQLIIVFVPGTVALKSYDLDNESLSECFSALFGIIVLFLVLSFLFLKFVNQKPKKQTLTVRLSSYPEVERLSSDEYFDVNDVSTLQLCVPLDDVSSAIKE